MEREFVEKLTQKLQMLHNSQRARFEIGPEDNGEDEDQNDVCIPEKYSDSRPPLRRFPHYSPQTSSQDCFIAWNQHGYSYINADSENNNSHSRNDEVAKDVNVSPRFGASYPLTPPASGDLGCFGFCTSTIESGKNNRNSLISASVLHGLPPSPSPSERKGNPSLSPSPTIRSRLGSLDGSLAQYVIESSASNRRRLESLASPPEA